MATWSSTERRPGFLRGLGITFAIGALVELVVALAVELSHSQRDWPAGILLTAALFPLGLALRAWHTGSRGHALGLCLGLLLWPPMAVLLLITFMAVHHLFTGRPLF